VGFRFVVAMVMHRLQRVRPRRCSAPPHTQVVSHNNAAISEQRLHSTTTRPVSSSRLSHIETARGMRWALRAAVALDSTSAEIAQANSSREVSRRERFQVDREEVLLHEHFGTHSLAHSHAHTDRHTLRWLEWVFAQMQRWRCCCCCQQTAVECGRLCVTSWASATMHRAAQATTMPTTPNGCASAQATSAPADSLQPSAAISSGADDNDGRAGPNERLAVGDSRSRRRNAPLAQHLDAFRLDASSSSSAASSRA
jgi:hypothetical protein